jgi:signal peptidase II
VGVSEAAADGAPQAPRILHRPGRMALWLGLVAALVGLDQASKQLAEALLAPYTPHAVVPGFFNLTLAYNPGAAFSFLAGAGGWQRWFFLALALVVGGVLLRWLLLRPAREILWPLAYTLILGGAIGNAVDRALHGHVIDFIQLYYRDWYWPAFNLADSAITIGAALYVWMSFREGGD